MEELFEILKEIESKIAIVENRIFLDQQILSQYKDDEKMLRFNMANAIKEEYDPETGEFGVCILKDTKIRLHNGKKRIEVPDITLVPEHFVRTKIIRSPDLKKIEGLLANQRVNWASIERGEPYLTFYPLKQKVDVVC